jgi:hypothetical protein
MVITGSIAHSAAGRLAAKLNRRGTLPDPDKIWLST